MQMRESACAVFIDVQEEFISKRGSEPRGAKSFGRNFDAPHIGAW
jgi:hypothetical protein